MLTFDLGTDKPQYSKGNGRTILFALAPKCFTGKELAFTHAKREIQATSPDTEAHHLHSFLDIS